MARAAIPAKIRAIVAPKQFKRFSAPLQKTISAPPETIRSIFSIAAKNRDRRFISVFDITLRFSFGAAFIDVRNAFTRLFAAGAAFVAERLRMLSFPSPDAVFSGQKHRFLEILLFSLLARPAAFYETLEIMVSLRPRHADRLPFSLADVPIDEAIRQTTTRSPAFTLIFPRRNAIAVCPLSEIGPAVEMENARTILRQIRQKSISVAVFSRRLGLKASPTIQTGRGTRF